MHIISKSIFTLLFHVVIFQRRKVVVQASDQTDILCSPNLCVKFIANAVEGKIVSDTVTTASWYICPPTILAIVVELILSKVT